MWTVPVLASAAIFCLGLFVMMLFRLAGGVAFNTHVDQAIELLTETCPCGTTRTVSHGVQLCPDCDRAVL